MEILGTTIFVIFIFLLILITIYCLVQFQLTFYYKRKYAHQKPERDILKMGDRFPKVTVQLPVFNEEHVIKRLIDSICALKYPADHLDIQILDDSTDQTTQFALEKIRYYQEKGVDIQLVRRKDRKGYKAGALQHGLNSAKGEFIAIFDADFIPNSNFLLKTIPHFADEKIGVVQTRWEHLNKNYSLITLLQAFQLNVHFSIEQTGREEAELFLQFNGTAGVWRRKAIEKAGGWSADTLTEDLDLSYRAQLKGYQVKYLESIGSPAELPAEMNGFKSQQYRWMKGGAETAKKIIPLLWRSKIPIRKKIHGTIHLMGSSVFLLVLLTGLLSIPSVWHIYQSAIPTAYLSVFLTGLLALIVVYYVGNVANPFYDGVNGIWGFLKFCGLFLVFLSLSMGMSLHNSIAVVHGYWGKRTPFNRTPKFKIVNAGDSFLKSKYLPQKIPTTTYFEGILAIGFITAFTYGISNGQNAMLFYHLLLGVGFGTICYYSFRHYQWRR